MSGPGPRASGAALPRRVPGAARQLAALVALRWRLVRSRRARGWLVAGSCLGALLVAAAGVAGTALPRAHAFGLTLVAPTAYLGFVALCVLSPLAAGGGVELFPADQLVVHPLRPGARFLGSLLLAPLNVAWFAQLLILVTATAYVTGPVAGAALALTTLAAYVVFATALGQALAGLVLRVWNARRGPLVVAGTLAGLGGWAYAAGPSTLTRLLDHSPTVRIVAAEAAGGAGGYLRWGLTTLVVAAAAVAAVAFGVLSARWAEGHPQPRTRPQRGPVRRRDRARLGAYRLLCAVDRASVWRAPALRRGMLVMVLAPAAVAAVGRPSYQVQALVPGLVAAGAGLLYGVNAFALDASGALWLASLPVRPALVFAAKARVVCECCLVPVAASTAAAWVVAPRPPTPAEAAAVTASAVASCAAVLAACMRASVLRPHHAEFRGGRDTPAPPAVMVGHSVRLAMTTTGLGLLFAVLGHADSPVPAVAVGLGFATLAGRSLVRSGRMWASEEHRQLVVATVARG